MYIYIYIHTPRRKFFRSANSLYLYSTYINAYTSRNESIHLLFKSPDTPIGEFNRNFLNAGFDLIKNNSTSRYRIVFAFICIFYLPLISSFNLPSLFFSFPNLPSFILTWYSSENSVFFLFFFWEKKGRKVYSDFKSRKLVTYLSYCVINYLLINYIV